MSINKAMLMFPFVVILLLVASPILALTAAYGWLKEELDTKKE